MFKFLCDKQLSLMLKLTTIQQEGLLVKLKLLGLKEETRNLSGPMERLTLNPTIRMTERMSKNLAKDLEVI